MLTTHDGFQVEFNTPYHGAYDILHIIWPTCICHKNSEWCNNMIKRDEVKEDLAQTLREIAEI